MAKYHITAEGDPALCRAQKRPCPLGGAHYASKQEAYEAYEKEHQSFPQRLSVADEQAIEAELRGDYHMTHRAPVKDADDFNKPLHRMDEIYPKDVYQHPKWYGLEHQETFEQLLRTRNKPEALVTIYRGVPKGVDEIHPGDWVALSYEYAANHALGNVTTEEQTGQIIALQVPAKYLYTDANSLEEWGFSGNISLKGVVKE